MAVQIGSNQLNLRLQIEEEFFTILLLFVFVVLRVVLAAVIGKVSTGNDYSG